MRADRVPSLSTTCPSEPEQDPPSGVCSCPILATGAYPIGTALHERSGRVRGHVLLGEHVCSFYDVDRRETAARGGQLPSYLVAQPRRRVTRVMHRASVLRGVEVLALVGHDICVVPGSERSTCWHNALMATTPPALAHPVTPPRSQPTTATTTQTPAPPSTPPKPKGELDRRTLTTARTFDVVLRSGQTWKSARLLEMDTWSLLVEADGRRVLLPKHAVDAYLLDPS